MVQTDFFLNISISAHTYYDWSKLLNYFPDNCCNQPLPQREPKYNNFWRFIQLVCTTKLGCTEWLVFQTMAGNQQFYPPLSFLLSPEGLNLSKVTQIESFLKIYPMSVVVNLKCIWWSFSRIMARNQRLAGFWTPGEGNWLNTTQNLIFPEGSSRKCLE